MKTEHHQGLCFIKGMPSGLYGESHTTELARGEGVLGLSRASAPAFRSEPAGREGFWERCRKTRDATSFGEGRGGDGCAEGGGGDERGPE